MYLFEFKSMYMRHDMIAMHGFGKMFEVFWYQQLSHSRELMKYLIDRGGVAETPNYKVKEKK